MKKYFITLFAAFSLLSLSANAGNIGVIDVDKIMNESLVMRDIQSKIEKKQDEYQKQIQKKQEELESEQKRIESKKNILSKEAFEKETNAFEKKLDDLKTFVDKKQNNLKKASMEAMSKVNEKVKDIIDGVAKEKKLDVIIAAAQTLYHEESLDVTNEILEKLNKKITKVDVKFD